MKNITIITLLIISFCSNAQLFTKELLGATILEEAFDVHSVDIDGDGLKDIVAGSRAFYLSNFDRISWYKNMGDNTFTQKKDINQTTSYIQKIFTIDFDQDGDVDVLSGTTEFSNDSKILLHRNLGNGEFAAPEVLITTNDYYYNFYVIDIDNDGFYDIISQTGYTNSSGPTRCYKNLGNGNLAAPFDLNGFTPYAEIKFIEDVDNDSLSDIIVYQSQGVYLMKNLGNMNFAPTLIYEPPFASYIMNFGDLNFDGKMDIILANPLSWIENLGNGNFSSVDTLNIAGPASASSASIEDLDNDGDMDIVTYLSSQFGNGISWLENDGSLNFSQGGDIFDCGSSSQCDDLVPLTDDFNNDGHKDVVIALPNLDRIEILYNNQSTQFESLTQVAGQTENMTDILNFDVDNDGDMDLVAVNRSMYGGAGFGIVSWYENIQNGVFSGKKILANGLEIGDIRKVDINLDGNIDLLVSLPNTAFTDKIVCFENQGNGNFAPGVQLTTSEQGESYEDFYLGDLNNNGFPDIVYLSYFSNGIRIHENQGNFNFSQSQPGPSAPYTDDLNLVDVNGDGQLDMVYSTNDGYILGKLNTGGGTFNSPLTILVNCNSNETNKYRLADIDSDLDLDIVYGADSIFWVENDGTGNFQSPTLIHPSFSPESELDVSDVDGDGDIDIVLAIWQDGSVRWLENNGLGDFNVTHEVTTNQTSTSPSPSLYDQRNVLCFDMDNDSDQEIFISSRDSLMVMRNNLVSPNQVSGTIFYDDNQNGIMDTNDYIVPQIEIATDNGGIITYSNSNGRYYLDFGNLNYNTYQVTPELPYNWEVTNIPQAYGVNYNSGFLSIDSIDFGIYPSVAVDSVEASLTGGFPRCNDTINYWLNIKNVGSTIASGVLNLELDNQIDYYQSNLQPDSVVGNNVYWSYDSLFYYQNETITIQAILPDFNSIGDTLSSTINGDVYDQSGNSVYHSESVFEQMLVCAYDPNDKMSAQAKFDPLGYIPVTQEYLDYTVRFQNTGNDTARVVVIKDQLDSNLIWNSISTISSSHEMDFDIDVDGLITFTFNDIYLPDSNVNFNGSQGFVKFKIGVEPNLFAGTQIRNYGQIYFDLNPAVVTNTRINTIDSTGPSLSTDNPYYALNPISIYPNPFNNSTTVDFGEDTNSNHRLSIYDMYGRKVFYKENISERKFIIHERDISKGLFIVVIQNDQHEYISTKKIICR